MKYLTFIILSFFCFINISYSLSKAEFEKVSKTSLNKDIPHITDITNPSFSATLHDTNPLWATFPDTNIQRPYFHGTVGPQFEFGQTEYKTYKHISSPVPNHPDNAARRIVPFNLPENTWSRSNTSPFNDPPRENTLSIDMPESKTTVVENTFYPNKLPMKQIETSAGNFLHNTRSVDPAINLGFNEKVNTWSEQTRNTMSSFIEIKNTQIPLAVEDQIKSVDKLKNEALEYTSSARKLAYRLGSKINATYPIDGRMVLPVVSLNKEDGDFGLYSDNKARDKLTDPVGYRGFYNIKKELN